MRIMAGSGTKASIIILTREDELESLVSGQRVGMTQEVKGSQSPVDPIQSQVFGQPVIKLIFPLARD